MGKNVLLEIEPSLNRLENSGIKGRTHYKWVSSSVHCSVWDIEIR